LLATVSRFRLEGQEPAPATPAPAGSARLQSIGHELPALGLAALH
jgi:hypothetical protein